MSNTARGLFNCLVAHLAIMLLSTSMVFAGHAGTKVHPANGRNSTTIQPAAIKQPECRPASSCIVSIYGRQYAQVQETRKAWLTSGQVFLKLTGIPSQYRQGSLRLVSVSGPGTFTNKSVTYKSPDLTRSQLLRHAIGKQILVCRKNIGAAWTKVPLIAVDEDNLIIRHTDTDYLDILPVSDLLIEVPSAPELSKDPSLVLEAETTAAGNYALTLIYETNGLGYDLKHSAIYNDNAATISSLESAVSINNHTDATFRNATIRLLSGTIAGNSRGFDKGVREYSDAPGGYASMSMAAPASASVEQLGDEAVYTLPGTFDLVKNETRDVTSLSASNIPVTKEYFLPAGNPWDNSDIKRQASIRLHLTNDNKHGLGNPLQAGRLLIYQVDASNNLQLTAVTQLAATACGECVDLALGKALDIKVERNLLSEKETPPAVAGQPKIIEQTFAITAHNYKSKDVDLTIEISLLAKSTISTSTYKLSRKSATQHTTVLKIPPTSTTKFNYTTRTEN